MPTAAPDEDAAVKRESETAAARGLTSESRSSARAAVAREESADDRLLTMLFCASRLDFCVATVVAAERSSETSWSIIDALSSPDARPLNVMVLIARSP